MKNKQKYIKPMIINLLRYYLNLNNFNNFISIRKTYQIFLFKNSYTNKYKISKFKKYNSNPNYQNI